MSHRAFADRTFRRAKVSAVGDRRCHVFHEKTAGGTVKAAGRDVLIVVHTLTHDRAG